METKTTAPPYIGYGALIHAWRNEVKFLKEKVAGNTGITVERLVDLEKGHQKPTWEELEKLAKEFHISVRDLLPMEDDRDRGVIILKRSEATKIDQFRAEKIQYTYWHRAMSSTLPNFKPVELLLHLTEKEDVVLNRGHFFHQYTQVLHGGPVGFVWIGEGETHYEELQEGDSWLIPGFVPHGFWSPNPDNLGRILAITFGQSLAAGDTRQELNLISAENATRIVNDQDDYY